MIFFNNLYSYSIYGNSSELVHNQYLKSNITITARHSSKVNIYYGRTALTLSEYNFIFSFCQVVFEKFDFKVWLWYGLGTTLLEVL